MQITFEVITIKDLSLIKQGFENLKTNLENVASEIKIEGGIADIELWKKMQSQIKLIDNILTQIKTSV